MNSILRNCCLAVLAFAVTASAHHSFAAFDQEKAVTVVGTVKEFQWVNPHSWIQMMVTDDKGTEVEWSIEMSSPTSLLRRGWKPKTLKPGDRITVVGHPLRDGRPGASFVSATLADGTKLGGSPTSEKD
jgi:hypothetical protein